MRASLRSERGFTLPELLVATGLLLVVSSIVTNALLQMTNQQQTIWNRTEMHSGVRGATELLQQEVGQAGGVVGVMRPLVGGPENRLDLALRHPLCHPVKSPFRRFRAAESAKERRGQQHQ